MSEFPAPPADDAVPLRPVTGARTFLSRRDVLAASAAGGAVLATAPAHAATFGNPDEPPQGAVNSSPGALSDPGLQNPKLQSQFPNAVNPPATDVGDMPQFWASFNNVHKRIQSGGWAREVTQADFPISTTVSGVNMRLSPGGIRELHWHQSAEWAYMTDGHCRITVLDAEGRAYVQDVSEGDLWFFPAGQPHSLQGIGPHGCEFLIVFDDGEASEFNTLLVTDWLAHTPPEVLALNFGIPAETFKSIPLHAFGSFRARSRGRSRPTRPRCAPAACRPIRLPSPSRARRPFAAIEAASCELRTAELSKSPPRSRRRWRRSSRAASARCTGTPTPTNGNTG